MRKFARKLKVNAQEKLKSVGRSRSPAPETSSAHNFTQPTEADPVQTQTSAVDQVASGITLLPSVTQVASMAPAQVQSDTMSPNGTTSSQSPSPQADPDLTRAEVKGAIDQARIAVSEMHSAGVVATGVTAAVDKANDGIGQIATLSDTWQPLLTKLKSFSDLVDKVAEVHPYAKMAWSVLSAAHKTILAQGDRDAHIQQLYKIMDNVYAIVLEAEFSRIESHKPLVACMAHQTIECGYFITSYAKDKNFWMRLVKNAMTGADTAIENFQVKFQELKKQFHEEAIRNSEITVKRTEMIVASILDEVKNLVTEVDLKDMPYATDARFRSDKQCLTGTREEILEEISDWINNPESSQNVFLLCGAAGTGKSAIAHTIAKRFDLLGHLGSSYCFVRSNQASRHTGNLFSTVAIDLANHCPQFKNALHEVVQDNSLQKILL